ncbi:MAG: thioredoxin-disulfide reductase [Peptoanaerobacter stomatis]
MKSYDVIIVGGGSAGLTAAIYTSRAKLKTLVLEKATFGGQISNTMDVENYPGSLGNESGQAIIDRMYEQAKKFGTEFISQEVIDFDFSNKLKLVKTKEETFESKAVILALGANPRKLGVKGEDEFVSKGVSYCATCDGPFFKDIEIFVVGGGDTALQEAIFLTKYASKVTVIHRRDEFRASKILQERAKNNEKIEFKMSCVIDEIKGDGLVNEIVIKDLKTGNTEQIKPQNEFNILGVFVFTGNVPNTGLFAKEFKLNSNGYFVAGEDMKLAQGVYVAGDCRQKRFRQVVTAASDGAIAALEAGAYIDESF